MPHRIPSNKGSYYYTLRQAIKASKVSFIKAYTLIRNGCPNCHRKWVVQIINSSLVYQCPECNIEFIHYDPRMEEIKV